MSSQDTTTRSIKKQVYIIIATALSLFLCSTFILVEMLPSPDSMYSSSSSEESAAFSVQTAIYDNRHRLTSGDSKAAKINIPTANNNNIMVENSRDSGKKSSLRHNYHDRITQKKSIEVEESSPQLDYDRQARMNEVVAKPEIVFHEAEESASESATDVHNNSREDSDSKDNLNSPSSSTDNQDDINEFNEDQSQPITLQQSLSINNPQQSTNSTEPRIIHILETRFMQNQPTLVQLAKARLHLLRTICLPTVKQQSNWGNFLWIIRTDPQLHYDIKEDLIQLLNNENVLLQKDENGIDEHALTYVIGSNDNYIVSNSTSLSLNVQPFDIRAMLMNALSQPDKIFAGKASNMQALLDDIPVSRIQNDVVLWTRLDADDGLNIGYMEYIQAQAIRYFLPDRYDREVMDMIPEESKDDEKDDNNEEEEEEKEEAEQPKKEKKLVNNLFTSPQWMYWCAGKNIDWFLTDPIHEPEHKNGMVFPVIHANVCVTPGVTVALRGGYNPNEIPRLDHDKIISYLRPLGGNACSRTGRAVYNETGMDDDEKDDEDDGTCFHLVASGISAIRSRTPTSAGMMGIKPDLNQIFILQKKPKLEKYMWRSMQEEFGVDTNRLLETNTYFAKHVYDIAEENARGQCTAGHSCKVRLSLCVT